MSDQSKMPPCIISAWELHERELHHWLLRQLSTEESPDDLQINHQIRVEAHLVA